MERLIPRVAIRLVSLLLSVSALKLLRRMPLFVAITAIVIMIERSLMATVAPGWREEYPCCGGR